MCKFSFTKAHKKWLLLKSSNCTIQIEKPQNHSRNVVRMENFMWTRKNRTTNRNGRERKSAHCSVQWKMVMVDDQRQRQSTCYCVINENIFGCNKAKWNHKLASFPVPFFLLSFSPQIIRGSAFLLYTQTNNGHIFFIFSFDGGS